MTKILTKQYDFATQRVTRWTPSIRLNFIDYIKSLSDYEMKKVLAFQDISSTTYFSWVNGAKNYGKRGVQCTRIHDTHTFSDHVRIKLDDEYREGMEVLNNSQLKIFSCLKERINHIVSKLEILTLLASNGTVPRHKIVDVHICHIRQIIKENRLPYRIETVWGLGYRLVNI